MTPRQRFLAARLAYVVLVLLATLTDLEFSADLAAASVRLARAFTLSLDWRDAIDGLRNVALFAGLGAVWVVTSLSGKVRREIWRATLTGLALSTTVEGLQAFSPVRYASIVDVSTNTLGALGGAVVTALFLGVVQRAKGEKSYVGIPMIVITGPYSAAVACEALAPLFSSSPLALAQGGPLSRLKLILDVSLPLEWSRVPVFDIPLYAAAGFLLVTLLREQRRAPAQAWGAVAGVGAVAVVALHVMHGALGLAIRWEEVITDAMSLGVGSWAASRWLGSLTQRYRGAARARLVIFGYAGLLLLWGWRPLLPETRGEIIAAQFSTSAFVPLESLSSRVDVFSALHVAQQFLLYLPLGALLAVWPLRFTGRWKHLWPAVWFSIVIELGHIVVVDRTFDATNAMLACSALGMGWIAVRRCGYVPYGTAMSSPS